MNVYSNFNMYNNLMYRSGSLLYSVESVPHLMTSLLKNGIEKKKQTKKFSTFFVSFLFYQKKEEEKKTKYRTKKRLMEVAICHLFQY